MATELSAAQRGDQAPACRTGCGCGSTAGKLAAFTFIAWAIQVPMLLFAVPRYAEFLREFGVKLPDVSVKVIQWSEWMREPIASTPVTGMVVYLATIFALAIFSYILAKVAGGFGRAVVVMICLLGGLIACGQAASVMLPTMMARNAIQATNP